MGESLEKFLEIWCFISVLLLQPRQFTIPGTHRTLTEWESGSSRDPCYQTPNVRLSTHLLKKDQLCSKWGGFVGAKQSITVACKNCVLRGRFASGQFLRLQIGHEVHDFCKKL